MLEKNSIKVVEVPQRCTALTFTSTWNVWYVLERGMKALLFESKITFVA